MSERARPVGYLHRVRHRVSHEVGYAYDYNRNDNDPGWWVKWPDGHEDWYAVDDLEFIGSHAGH